MTTPSRAARRAGLIASFPLVFAACAGAATPTTAPSTAPTTAPTTAPATSAPSAALGAAAAMAVTVAGLAPGAIVTANAVTISVAAAGYTLSCPDAGKANADGIGHYHVALDHALVNMYCTPTATISMQNVAPGPHTLTVLPAKNDHEEVKEGAVSVDFTYAPTSPLPTISGASAGTPTIAFVSPAPGSTVSGDFTVTVKTSGITLANALFGKTNVPGYGHWHLNVDSTSGPMMGMATMMGMSGTDTFQGSTKGIAPGMHSFFAILVDNQHAPLMPEVVAQVDLVVK